MARTKGSTKYNQKTLREAVDRYFRKISYEVQAVDEDGNGIYNLDGEPVMVTKYATPPSIAALRLELGIMSKTTWAAYAKNPKMAAICEEASLRIQAFNVPLLYDKGSFNGSSFTLKNLGWSDKQHIEVETGQEATKAISMSLDERFRLLAEEAGHAEEETK